MLTKQNSKVLVYFIPIVLALLSAKAIISLSTIQFIVLAGIIFTFLILINYPEIGLIFYVLAFDSFSYLGDHLNIPLGLRSIAFALPMVVLLVVYAIRKGKSSRLYLNYVFLIAISFGLYLFIRLSGTPSPFYGIWKAKAYLLFNLLGMTGIILFSGEPSSQRRIILAAAILGIVTCAVSIHPILTSNLKWERFMGYSNPIWLARSIGAYILAIIFIIITTKYRSLKLCLLIIVVGLLYIMLNTGSRGPVFAFCITLAFIPFFLPVKSLMTKISIFLFLIILGISLFITLPSIAQERYSILLQRGGYMEDIDSSVRIDLYNIAFNLFQSNPIWGIGTGGYSRFASHYDFRLYPHNIFLEIGSELGLVGLILFLIFVIMNIVKLKKLTVPYTSGIYKSNIFLSWAALLFIFGCANALVSGDIASNSMIWFSSGALIVAENSKKELANENLLYRR